MKIFALSLNEVFNWKYVKSASVNSEKYQWKLCICVYAKVLWGIYGNEHNSACNNGGKLGEE